MQCANKGDAVAMQCANKGSARFNLIDKLSDEKPTYWHSQPDNKLDVQMRNGTCYNSQLQAAPKA